MFETAVGYAVFYLLLIGMAGGWLAWVVLGKSKLLARDHKANFAILLPLGVAGSFVGGLGLNLLMGNGFQLEISGFIASAIGSIAVVAAYLAIKAR